MVTLARRVFVLSLVEGESELFMVREDGEVPGFQHVAEVFYGFVDGQEFPVVCSVLLLRRAQLR